MDGMFWRIDTGPSRPIGRAVSVNGFSSDRKAMALCAWIEEPHRERFRDGRRCCDE